MKTLSRYQYEGLRARRLVDCINMLAVSELERERERERDWSKWEGEKETGVEHELPSPGRSRLAGSCAISSLMRS